MNESHLASLKCPNCGKKLILNGNAAPLEEVEEGEIVCEKGHI